MKEELHKSLTDILKDDPREASRKSWAWYSKNVRTLAAKTSALKFLGSTVGNQTKKDILPGTMIFYFYDPISKLEMEYYDTAPLILVLSIRDDKKGFFGINTHYLKPNLRILLLDKLIKITESKRYNSKDKLIFTWQTVKAFADLPQVKNAVKQYLFRQVKSNFGIIPIEEMRYSVLLPTERFKGATNEKVWSDSNART